MSAPAQAHTVNTCSSSHACFPHYLQASAVEVIAVSSSSASPDSDDKKLYEDDQNFDVVYDTDKILAERLRPLNAEHAAMCDMECQTMCTHYLVKWAGYPTSNSTWTPATLCSKNLVDHYLQQKRQPRQEGLCLIPSRELPRFSYPIVYDSDDDDVPIVRAPLSPILPLDRAAPTLVGAIQPSSSFPIPLELSRDLDVKAVLPNHSPLIQPLLDDGAAPSKKVKKANCVQADACMLEVSTLDEFKCRVAECNSDCIVRIRGRDSKKGGLFNTVRLGCKRVNGTMPCSLQIYCDIKSDGVPSNIR